MNWKHITSTLVVLTQFSLIPLTWADSTQADQTISGLKQQIQETRQKAYEIEMALKHLPSKPDQSANWQQVNLQTAPDQASDGKSDTQLSLKAGLQYFQNQYLLKPKDLLMVNFIGEDPIRGTDKETAQNDVTHSFLHKLPILTDGTIVLPPIGMIKASGKSLKNLNEELNERLGHYYRFATVTVSLNQAAPDKIMVLGSVNKQGFANVPVGTRLSKLFQEIGGVKDNADLTHIFIKKQADNQVHMANLDALFASGDTAQDLMLQHGDMVVVPQSESSVDYSLYAHTAVVPSEFNVRFLGPFGKQETLQLQPGDRLASAVAKAGGVASFASNSKISLLRIDPKTKEMTTFTFKQKDLVNPETAVEKNIALRPDDVLVLEDPTWRRSLFSFFTDATVNSLGFFFAQTLFTKALASTR